MLSIFFFNNIDQVVNAFHAIGFFLYFPKTWQIQINSIRKSYDGQSFTSAERKENC